MNRRRFLKSVCATGAVLVVGGNLVQESKTRTMETSNKPSLAAPCGLYCGICLDLINGECHGCGCACGECAGQAHVQECAIATCVKHKKLESCSQCEDLPCTEVIQFTNDPIWQTHSPCIENLRRRKKVGAAAWLREQEAYWSKEKRRQRWLQLYEECGRRWQEATNPTQRKAAD